MTNRAPSSLHRHTREMSAHGRRRAFLRSFKRTKNEENDSATEENTLFYEQSESKESVQNNKTGIASLTESFELLSEQSPRHFVPAAESEEVPEDGLLDDRKNESVINLEQDFDVLDPSIYFIDGVRKIDYVLLFLETLDEYRKRTAGLDLIEEANKRERWRSRFLHSIHKNGLETEEEIVFRGKRVSTFVKVHATWPVLCHYAEELNLRVPLLAKKDASDLNNGSEMLLQYLGVPNPMKLEMPTQLSHFYTCPFRKNKIARFHGSWNKEKYFSTIQRIRIVHEVLSSAVFGKQRKGEVGIDRLVHEGVFAAAYSLHDGPYKKTQSRDELNPRQILYEFWARWGRWYKYQPLDHIRNYFGEKIGMYFAWLGFYTTWLFPAAVVGILVFLFGLFTVFDNAYVNDVCEKPGKYKMCPQHELGRYWDLFDICTYLRISYLFDHPGSVFYSIFISFWAVAFLEYWKRKCATLAYQWDCTDFQGEEERPRAEYAAKAPYVAVNPVTGVREPMFPSKTRGKRVATGLGLVFVMISVVVIFIFAIIVFRIAIAIPLHSMNMTRTYAHTLANVSGAGLNFVLIMLMSKLYEWLARRLTHWEMHRTQSEYDDNYTFKVFVFQFVNFYSSIFYIAFFKGRFVGYPGKFVYVFNMRNEECEEGGCLIELAQQLAIIMIGKQVINNLMEIGLPWAKSWWIRIRAGFHAAKPSTDGNHQSQIHADYYTSPNDGLFDEYLEMVLQFGFITLFVAAFPLAPLFALLNNWVEIRLDAQKFVCHTRRSVPERAGDIGMWFRILQYLAHIAVITNGLLIAFTSRFLMKLLYQYEYNWSEEGYYDFILSWAPQGTYNESCRYRGQRDQNGNYTMFFWKLLAVQFAFVLAFEYVVFTVCRLIDIFVSDVPASVDIKIRRERYLAKQALLDNDLYKQSEWESTDITPKGYIMNATALGSNGQLPNVRKRALFKRHKKPKMTASCSERNFNDDEDNAHWNFHYSHEFLQKNEVDSQAANVALDKCTQTEENTVKKRKIVERRKSLRKTRAASCVVTSRSIKHCADGHNRRSYPRGTLSNASSVSDVFIQFPNDLDETDSSALSSS